MKKLFFMLALSGAFQTAFAQNDLKMPELPRMSVLDDGIVTDRPDQTEAPNITPRGFFQVETGSQCEFDKTPDDAVRTKEMLYNTTLWKYGVTETFELRLITEYAGATERINLPAFGIDTFIANKGLNPFAIGTKIALQEESGIIPKISLLAHLELPYFGAPAFKPQYVVPRFRFSFAHTLSDQITFSYNLGAEWEDGTNAATGIYSASFGIGLTERLSMFLESYGFLKEKERADHRFDAGFTYLVNRNFQLDVSGGVGLTENAPNYFISGGLSYRFNAFNTTINRQRVSLR